MGAFSALVAWFTGRAKPEVALVERDFMRTCTSVSLILQDALYDAEEEEWTHSRACLASATHAYFTYALWNWRSNRNDAAFNRALDRQLERLAEDIARHERIHREAIEEVVRISLPVLKRAYDAMGSSDPQTATDFPFILLHHLLKIVIDERAASSLAFDPDIAMRLVGVMSEAVAALRSSRAR